MRTARLVSRVLALFSIMAVIEIFWASATQPLSGVVARSMIAASVFTVVAELLLTSLRRPWFEFSVVLLGPLLVFGAGLFSHAPPPRLTWPRIAAGIGLGFVGILLQRLFQSPPALIDGQQQLDLQSSLRSMRDRQRQHGAKTHSSNDAPK